MDSYRADPSSGGSAATSGLEKEQDKKYFTMKNSPTIIVAPEIGAFLIRMTEIGMMDKETAYLWL